MKHLFLTLSLFLLTAHLTHAEEDDLIKGFDFTCTEEAINDAISSSKTLHFKELQDKAKIASLKICNNMLDDPTGSMSDVEILLKGTDSLVDASGNSFSFSAELYETWSKNFDFEIFNGMQPLAYDVSFYQPKIDNLFGGFKELELRQKGGRACRRKEPECITDIEYRSSRAKLSYPFYDNTEASEQQLNACENMGPGFSNCYKALEELSFAIKPYGHFVRIGNLDRAQKTLNLLNKQWDNFSKNSRYQTFPDKLLTTLIYRDQFNGQDWSGPPEYQFFLFHPGVVLTHFSANSDGDQTEMGLSMEWLGINKWDGDLPLGVSVTSVYADRNNSKDVGHGLMFHIKNKYSIGVAYHGDGDKSVFINLELFNWFTDKQDKYKKYEDKMGNFRLPSL